MNLHRLPIYLAACVMAFSCNVKSERPIEESRIVAVSIEPQRNILEHLIDSTYAVRTLLARDANPETFEPSMKERVRVDSAELYFSTGVLTFENALEKSATNTRFINTSEGIDIIYDTHGHAGKDEHHRTADPHYWTSIDGVRTTALNMAQALVAYYPADSANIVRRLARYNARLDSLAEELSEKLAGREGASFAVWHPSLSYFAREYGLKQISLGTESKEMSAKGLKDAIDKARSMGVKVFFFQKEFDSRQAISINESIGSRIVEIFPMDYDWENQLKLIADEIAGAQ